MGRMRRVYVGRVGPTIIVLSHYVDPPRGASSFAPNQRPTLAVLSHYVDPPERRYRRLDDASGHVRRSHVRRHRHRPPARRTDAPGDGLRGGSIEVTGDDRGAVRGQQEGRGLTDALAGAFERAGSSMFSAATGWL